MGYTRIRRIESRFPQKCEKCGGQIPRRATCFQGYADDALEDTGRSIVICEKCGEAFGGEEVSDYFGDLENALGIGKATKKVAKLSPMEEIAKNAPWRFSDERRPFAA